MTEYATPGDLINALLVTLPLEFKSMDLDWEIKIRVDPIPRLQIKAYIPKHKPKKVVEVTHILSRETVDVIPHLAEHITRKFTQVVKERYMVN